VLWYDPSHDECFAAERGRGAWLNGEPLKVSAVTDLEKSLHATAFARQDLAKFERNLGQFAHLSRFSFGVRRMGCAALELCYVSCARLDAYWEWASTCGISLLPPSSWKKPAQR